MNNVMEAVETIVEANITICEASTNDLHIDFDDKDKREKSQDFIEAIQTIRDAYPEDLRDRREAAAEYIKRNINADKGLDILNWSTDNLLCRLLRRRAVKPIIKPPEFCAWKRLLNIRTGDFSAESEYYQPESDYPESWLKKMNQENAKMLYTVLQAGKYPFDSPLECGWYSVSLLVDEGYCYYAKIGSDEGWGAYANRAPFQWGLELPDFVDKEDL